MSRDSIATATGLLYALIEKQPNLIKQEAACKEGGEAVADFCAGFIQKYSELLDTLQKSQR